MAVLKMWDGSQWVPVGAGAPAVASPLTVSGTGVIDINHIEEVGGAPNVSYVAEGGNVNLEAAYWAFLASNLRDDGTNWQRYRTADKGLALAAEYGGALHLYDTPAAANPATLTERLRIDTPGGSAQLRATAAGLDLMSATSTYFGGNAYFDGTNWQRVNTGLSACMLHVSYNGNIWAWYAAAGANPITWSTYSLTEGSKPAVPRTAITTFAAGWSSYGAGLDAMYSRDAFGYVHLEGLANKGSAATSGELVLTMPVGFRPINTLSLIHNNSAGTGAQASLANTGGFNTYAVGATWVSLSNIHYLAA